MSSNNPANINILEGDFTQGPNVFEKNLNIERLDVPVVKHDIGPAISIRPNIEVITNETGIEVETKKEELVLLEDILQELRGKPVEKREEEVIPFIKTTEEAVQTKKVVDDMFTRLTSRSQNEFVVRPSPGNHNEPSLRVPKFHSVSSFINPNDEM